MTPETAKKLLPLITAIADGKQIQRTHYCETGFRWIDVPTINPLDPIEYYRVKPEPVVVERWVAVYSDGISNYLYKDQETCKVSASRRRSLIACVKVTVKYEEGEGL